MHNAAPQQAAAKEAMQHSWNAYERFAFGYDELKPISQVPQTTFGDTAASMVDSLCTLWVLNMTDEFAR